MRHCINLKEVICRSLYIKIVSTRMRCSLPTSIKGHKRDGMYVLFLDDRSSGAVVARVRPPLVATVCRGGRRAASSKAT